jgi:hypothetical protein
LILVPPFDHIYQHGKIGEEKMACTNYNDETRARMDFMDMLKEESFPDVPDVEDSTITKMTLPISVMTTPIL